MPDPLPQTWQLTLPSLQTLLCRSPRFRERQNEAGVGRTEIYCNPPVSWWAEFAVRADLWELADVPVFPLTVTLTRPLEEVLGPYTTHQKAAVVGSRMHRLDPGLIVLRLVDHPTFIRTGCKTHWPPLGVPPPDDPRIPQRGPVIVQGQAELTEWLKGEVGEQSPVKIDGEGGIRK